MNNIFFKSMVLKQGFYHRNVLQVARDLLGCRLIVKSEMGMVSSIICETEAYDGEQDLACHACKGKTKRTSIMYDCGGVWYVYLCYGMHWMLNIVTGPKNYPATVLIRGTRDFSGPGRLTRNLGLDGSLHGKPAVPSSGLWIEDVSKRKPPEILTGPRIGVDYAGKEWAQKPYRFWFS